MNNNRANTSLCFPLSFLVSKLTLLNLLEILGVIFDKNFTFRSHISAVCSSCGICSVFAITWIWILQNYLQLPLCPVVLIITIHFCMVSLTLISLGFIGIDWPWWQSPPFTRSLPLCRSLQWLPVTFWILFKIELLPYKTLREKQPLYLHSMLTASIPSRSLRSNNDNSLSVPWVKTNTGARASHSCAPSLFGTTSRCLSFPPFQLLPLRNIWRHLSLTWPFLHRYWNARWPVDVMQLFPQFCCCTLIQLSRHWAWLRWGYWRDRSLIDWLICW